jgi:hypothetical protein
VFYDNPVFLEFIENDPPALPWRIATQWRYSRSMQPPVLQSALCLAVCLMLPVCLAGQQNDWKIVPGVRIGPITRESTLDSLKKQFGAANVRQEMLADEMHEYEGTVIYPDSPARRLVITWDDSNHHPSEIHVGHLEGISPGAWKTAEGIAIGTSLLQLEKVNGHAFHLAGFAWDYSGTVTSWDDGRLAPLKASGVELSLDPQLAPAAVRTKFWEQVRGDGFFPSTHPAMQALNPLVSLIRFFFAK